jgi:hypothetical protein
VRNDPGDADGDGFSELEGCYVLECDPRGAEFILHGAGASRVSPAFKLLHWQGEAPKAIALDGATLASGRDFVASAANGVLLLQVLKTFMTDARIVIRQDIAPAEAAVEPQAVRKPAPGDVRAAGDDPAKDAGPVEVSDIVEKLVFDAAAKLTASAADAQPRPGVFRGCRVALTKDSPFGAGRQALRIDILRDTWQMEIKPVPPELDVWEKYDYLTFEVHNAERDMGDLVWRIEGPGVTGRNNVWHKEMLLRPGGNRIEIQLTGAPVDWSKAVSSWEFSQFQMSTSVGATLYLRNLALEKGDPRARRRKGVNVVHIESSDTFQRFGKVQAAEPGGGPPAK